MIVLLDTAILTLLINIDSPNLDALACQKWLDKLLSRGIYVISSEICDHETRRGLLLIDKRKNRTNGPRTQALDLFRQRIDFLPIDTKVLQKASEIWADQRMQGKGSSKGIDADLFLLAHWMLLKEEFPGRYIVIATTNLRHFTDLAEAQHWREIQP